MVKSSLVGFGVNEGLIKEWVELIMYKMDVLPTDYMGVLLETTPNVLSMWNSIVDKAKKCLAMWKSKSLSFGGRVALIKAVLNSLSLYFISLFHILVSVAKKIDCIRRRFLWSGTNEKKKKFIRLIGSMSCFRKDKGDLGLGNLTVKNCGLILKWMWRFGNDIGSL